MTLRSKIRGVMHHPWIIKDVVQGKSKEQITNKFVTLEQERSKKDAIEFIEQLKLGSPYYQSSNDKTTLNKLCAIEDWENEEIKEALSELKQEGLPGFIHRKPWEWALGIVAMQRFGKLNKRSTAIGVGSGKEPILFYLANHLNHVYATDLYDGEVWNDAAHEDFPENPKKYASFAYKEDALTVLRMNGTKLEFPSDGFDIAFSFSSIEHFGGENHSGALRSLREIERVLKPGGIAVITTEYMIHNKEHLEFFNRETIYSDLIDKLQMQLVEPLDLRITTRTIDTVMDFFDSVNWSHTDHEYKRTLYGILFTSVMLVFQK